jgi:D-glycero-alpha-D-manno-heptose-7-phosphate kinase
MLVNTGDKDLSRRDILHLGYHIEDGLSGGNCGIQDQAVAVYGGVNMWTWSYGKRDLNLKRESLVDDKDLMDLSDHILVAYSGKSHISSHTNKAWVNSFLTGKTRSGWIKVNEIVHKFSLSIREKDWESAMGYLKDEMMIRREITPEAVIPITERLIDEAEEAGCGARFTGAGAGGSVWSMGNPDNIARLKTIWENTLKHIGGARILDCALDSDGVS